MRPVDHSVPVFKTSALDAIRREAARLWIFGYLMVVAPTVGLLEAKAKRVIDYVIDGR